jgi:hypothetical protein
MLNFVCLTAVAGHSRAPVCLNLLYTGWFLNPGPPEYEAGMLRTTTFGMKKEGSFQRRVTVTKELAAEHVNSDTVKALALAVATSVFSTFVQ